MIQLDRRYGPWSGRVWGLILNLGGNALALYGAAGVLRHGRGTGTLVAGAIITVICLLVLAIPAADAPPSPASTEGAG